MLPADRRGCAGLAGCPVTQATGGWGVVYSFFLTPCTKQQVCLHCPIPRGQGAYLVLKSLSIDLGWKIKLAVSKLHKVRCCPPGHLSGCSKLTRAGGGSVKPVLLHLPQQAAGKSSKNIFGFTPVAGDTLKQGQDRGCSTRRGVNLKALVEEGAAGQ